MPEQPAPPQPAGFVVRHRWTSNGEHTVELVPVEDSRELVARRAALHELWRGLLTETAERMARAAAGSEPTTPREPDAPAA